MTEEYTDEQLHALWIEDRKHEEIIDARSEADQLAIENEIFNWNLN